MGLHLAGGSTSRDLFCSAGGGFGPVCDLPGKDRVVRSLGWTCRTGHAVGKTESDPQRPSPDCRWCIAEGSFAMDVGGLG
jgi:hypothetical protein